MSKKKLQLSKEWKNRRLPKSCIESTCHSIQRIRKDWTTWKNSNTTTKSVGVWAVFKNKLICVNRVSNLAAHFTGVEGFEPSQISKNTLYDSLSVGRGLVVANSTTTDQKFNMHLGAVLELNDMEVLITDMVEDGPIVNSKIETITLGATTVETDFRKPDYGDTGVFKIGLLVSEEDSCFADLRKKYKDAEVVDESI